MITWSYFLFEVLRRHAGTLGTIALIGVLQIWNNTQGILSVTCDYLNDYDTQTEYICLDGDYALD